MSDKPEIIYRYQGKGEAYRSVPARDLTQVDYDRLPLTAQVAVDTGDLYRAVEKKKQQAGDGETKGGDS